VESNAAALPRNGLYAFLEKQQEGEEQHSGGELEKRDGGGRGEQNGDGGEDRGRTVAEWVTLGVSVAIVLALAGLVLFQWLSQGTRPPEISVEPNTEQVRQVGDLYYLPIRVTNGGEKAVEVVEVETELRVEGEEPETVGFTVQFLAGRESDEFTVVLSGDPREGELSHTISFHEP
jgi:uncharacterized protein (TIGR02588 family)